MKNIKFTFIWAAILLAAVIGLLQHSLAAFALLLIATAFINAGFTRPAGCLRVTLSVPELSQLVLEAFKIQTPELFEPGGFALDIESKTARLNDKITSHIGQVPTAQNYDPTPGVGFASGVQDSTDLLQDVPVTLSYFKHVPIRIKWLTQLSSKINLSVALMEQGYALRKLLIDTALGVILPANFTYQKAVDPANVNLDSVEALRSKLNTQKAAPFGRFGIVSTAFAGALQADQRVGSSLFYNMLNGDTAYRRYKNLAGFANIYEYPDMPSAANLSGYFGDRRGIIVAVRPIDFAQVSPEALGIPKIMSFTPMVDQETGLPFVAVGWQDPGTGDLYISIGILFGVAGGNQGGAANTITDRAGVRVVTSGNDV
jgi:hypothetical protein